MLQAHSVQKVCPLVVRHTDSAAGLLAFEHPFAKKQFVKGTIDPGEDPQVAARRELLEESGLRAIAGSRLITVSGNLPDNNVWHFYLCEIPAELPDSWVYLTQDDGGHVFRFFWHCLADTLDESWHPLFHAVYAIVQPRLIKQLTQSTQHPGE